MNLRPVSQPLPPLPDVLGLLASLALSRDAPLVHAMAVAIADAEAGDEEWRRAPWLDRTRDEQDACRWIALQMLTADRAHWRQAEQAWVAPTRRDRVSVMAEAGQRAAQHNRRWPTPWARSTPVTQAYWRLIAGAALDAAAAFVRGPAPSAPAAVAEQAA